MEKRYSAGAETLAASSLSTFFRIIGIRRELPLNADKYFSNQERLFRVCFCMKQFSGVRERHDQGRPSRFRRPVEIVLRIFYLDSALAKRRRNERNPEEASSQFAPERLTGVRRAEDGLVEILQQ